MRRISSNLKGKILGSIPIVLVLCMVTCLAGGAVPPARADAAGAGAPDQLLSAENPYEGMSWEEMYTDRHLDFVRSGLYHEIVMSAEGGLAGVIKRDYEHARLNIVNGTWQIFDNTVRLVFDSDATEKTEQVITLTSEYDPIIGDLMYATATSAYVSSFEDAYYGAWSDMLKEVLSAFSAENAAISFIAGDSEHSKLLEATDDQAYTISQYQTLVNSINTSDTRDVKLLQDKLDDLKDKLNNTLDLGQLDRLAKGVGLVESGLSIAGGTASEALDMYCLFKASSSATQEWMAAWKAISRQAKVNGTGEGRKISASIEEMLFDIQTSQRSMAAAMAKQTAKSLAKHVGVTVAEWGFSYFANCIDRVPILRAIHLGAEYGVKLADLVTGMDDVAFYGNMMCTVGDVAVAVHPCMVDAADALEARPGYDTAKAFHEMYHIFQAIQVYACNTGISYSSAVVDNVLGYVFKYQSDDEVAQSVRLQAYKAKLLEAACHEMSPKECRQILVSWGYSNVSLERIGTSYDYYVHADEVAHAQYQLIVDASTGNLVAQADVEPVLEDASPISFTRVVANLWNRKRCRPDETGEKTVYTERFAPMANGEIEAVVPNLGFASWKILPSGGESRSCTVLSYYHTYLDYVLMVDQVSGIAVSTVDDLIWGYYDFCTRSPLVGAPCPPEDPPEEEAGAPESLAGGRMTREEADAAVTAFFGSNALKDYAFVNDQTDGLLLYIDTITQMQIEVSLDTGVLRRISGSGIVYETFQFTR